MLTDLSWLMWGIFNLGMLGALAFGIRMRAVARSHFQREWATVILLMTLVYPWSALMGHLFARVMNKHLLATVPLGLVIVIWSHVYFAIGLLPLIWAIGLGFRLLQGHQLEAPQ